MIFNSSIFAVFLVFVFAIYWGILRNRLRAQNLFIVIASYFFYGWWDWRFLSLLLFSSVIDFTTAYYMDKTDMVKRRKFLLGISLVTNLGLLGVFKYFDFFADSLVALAAHFNWHLHPATLHIILPVGISFYTFQTLSYTIDVYRKNLKASGDLVAFSAFVSFFPQLVAGPIERASHLLPQFYVPRKFEFDKATSGMRLMLWGFFKKIVIADNMGVYADRIFNNAEMFHGSAIVAGSVFFALQIYCDFSGYSDIAIGCARLFGFDIMKNFDTPYFSASPREFWRRWHISLSTWFRDYLYIPLGGNKSGFRRMQVNLLITFIISGLWHGANWTFVVWGVLHGSALVIQNYFTKWKIPWPFSRFFSGLLLFLFICFGWIFFRANSIDDAFLLVQHIFTPVTTGEWSRIFTSAAVTSENMQSLALFLLLEILIRNVKMVQWFNTAKAPIRWVFYYVLVIWILVYGALNQPPHFIYFQF